MLRFFKNKNKKTGSRHYIQSIQNQIKLFHQLEILQKKENISKNSTRVTGLQLIKKDNLDDSDVYGRNGIKIIIVNVNLGLISEIYILTQWNDIIKSQRISVHHEGDLVNRSAEEEQTHLDCVVVALRVQNIRNERNYLRDQLRHLEDQFCLSFFQKLLLFLKVSLIF